MRRKSVLTRSTLPGKLADCTSELRGKGGGGELLVVNIWTRIVFERKEPEECG